MRTNNRSISNPDRAIRALRNIIYALVGGVIGITLLTYLLTALPPFQRRLAGSVAEILSEQLDTRVSVGNVFVGLFNRVVIDDVTIDDQRGRPMLHAARISAKIDILPLLDGRIRVGNIQLLGYRIRMEKESEAAPYNFQFIADRLASKDTTKHTPLDLAISAILVRRGTIEHRSPVGWQNVVLNDLSVRASIETLTDDSISLAIKHLSFTDSLSKFNLKGLRLHLAANRREVVLSDMNLQLPASELTADVTVRKYNESSTLFNGFTLTDMYARADIAASIEPADISPLVPLAAHVVHPADFSTQAELNHGSIRLTDTSLSSEGLTWSSRLVSASLLQDSTLRLGSAGLELNALRISRELRADAEQLLPQIIHNVNTANAVCEWIDRLDGSEVRGDASYTQDEASAQLTLQTPVGKLYLDASVCNQDRFSLIALADDIKVQDTGTPLQMKSGKVEVSGSIREKSVKTLAEASDLTISQLTFSHLDADIDASPRHLRGNMNVKGSDLRGSLTADLTTDTDFQPTMEGLDHLRGLVKAGGIHWQRGEKALDIDEVTVNTYEDNAERQLLIDGDFLTLQASGRYSYARIVPICRQMLHRAMPTLIPASAQDTLTQGYDYLRLTADLFDLEPFATLAGIDMSISQRARLTVSLNQSSRTLQADGHAPSLRLGGETLRNVRWLVREVADSIYANVTADRQMQQNLLTLKLETSVANDLFRTQVNWDNQRLPAYNGGLSLNSKFFRTAGASLGADIAIAPSEMTVADTTWHIHPSSIRLDEGKIHVSGFQLSSAQTRPPQLAASLPHSLRIDGIASSEDSDTLLAELQSIDLQYIFNMINFHAVEFSGKATGTVHAHGILSSPKVDAAINVPDFTLNDGLLGSLYLRGGFARLGEKTIDLNGLIREPIKGLQTAVVGTVVPGHGEGSGLNLDFHAQHLNAYFINAFTKSIFDDLQGRVSGHAHLFGPFKSLDIEGDLCIDTASVGIPVLGTRYYVARDSLRLRPGAISMSGARATDREGHEGFITGRLLHEHFSNLRYSFDINAERLLCYDFHDFGDHSFYGTVYADGHVRLNGQPGELTVDLEGTPRAGTIFTYNATSPDISTDDTFIRYTAIKPAGRPAGTTAAHSHAAPTGSAPAALAPEQADSVPVPPLSDDTDTETDMRINFNLDITPEATMRLLMDARSEDYITVNGGGNIRATYYNKGSFQMFGTYTVDHGSYRLSLQDVIRKDFRLEQGSTLTFQGAPMKGDLDIRAIYTVPGVSLNDLAVGSNFSSSTVRVNCIMNITGQAGRPQVAFDFDIPNVNEDEKQMVRSLISTEEERNMQVIYLLGIGRFYTYNAADAQMQTNSAMQSLLSTTLSGQLNEYLRRAIGNSGNWNFGTNLSTGEMGWSDMDVEGMLSGRLLNNRLLINGTFGYRDTPVANTNFIGDFDVQWLLTPNGNVSLKAYSETNDRYFTKTALTTQGIGIQLKKDFSSLRELFRRNTSNGARQK